MKFNMGAETLGILAKGTEGSHQDLGAMVRRLVVVADQMKDDFHGAGRAAFDSFKARTDEISADLNTSLASILQGQAGMDTAFQTGDQEASDNATQAMASANFDGARFRSQA